MGSIMKQELELEMNKGKQHRQVDIQSTNWLIKIYSPWVHHKVELSKNLVEHQALNPYLLTHACTVALAVVKPS